MLSNFYQDGIIGFANVEIGEDSVAGVFFDSDRTAYRFTLSDRAVSYAPTNYRPDSATIASVLQMAGLPQDVFSDRAYNEGFLAQWFKVDAKDAPKKKCKIGYSCGGGCINKEFECSLRVPRNITKQARDLISAGKAVKKAAGTGQVGAILGVAAIAITGAALIALASQWAKQEAAPIPPPAAPPPKPKRERKPKTEASGDIPDPWEDEPDSKPQEQPVELVEQLPIDQGVRYVETERIVAVSIENADGTHQMAIGDIRLAPKVFQYKLPNEIGSSASKRFKEEGTTGALEDVTIWNPQVAGAIKVWKVPEDFSYEDESFKAGEVVVVHGHHRLSLAKRAEAIANTDPTQPPTPGKPETVKVEFINANNWREARVLGAMENIATGAGTSRDAANIFRELGLSSTDDLKAQGLSLKNKIAEEGVGLAGLNDRLWRKVTDPSNAELKIPQAAAIGRIRNSDLQDEVWKQVQDTRNPSNEFVKSLSQTVQHQLETGQVQTRSTSEDEGQFALFDTEKVVANLKDRAEVDSFIELEIGREANFWKRAAKPARMQQILTQEGAGDINIDRASDVSEQTSIARFLYRKGKFLSGDENYTAINDVLARAGNELRDLKVAGAKDTEIKKFKRSTYEQIRTLLAKEIGG